MKIIKLIFKGVLPYGIVRILQKRKNKKKPPFFFEFHVVEHCNLNCKGCSHFSCLADEEYLDKNVFERDCQRLSVLSKEISQITINGGEPLLHPEIISFFDIARKYFSKKTVLRLTTNGILLPKQTDEFWKACANYDVHIDISNYPVNVENDKIAVFVKKYGVNIAYNYNVKSTDDPKEKLMYKIPMDLDGRQNIVDSYSKCPHPGCITLRNGKIYRCCTIAHIKFFNKHFGSNLQITEGDWIDIFKVNTIDEIHKFLSGPFPFCRYCKPLEKRNDVKWAVTKRAIEEWV